MADEKHLHEYLTVSDAFEYVGRIWKGTKWPQIRARKRLGAATPHRKILEFLRDGLQSGSITFRTEDGKTLERDNVDWIRTADNTIITIDARLVPIKINLNSLDGALRDRGLILLKNKGGRPPKIDWPNFIHEAWRYALCRNGEFKDEEMKVHLDQLADNASIDRPTRTTLDRWCTKIRDSFRDNKVR